MTEKTKMNIRQWPLQALNLKLWTTNSVCLRVWPCVREVLREDSMYDELVQMGSVHLITQAELPAVTARGSRIPISAEPNTPPVILFEYLDIKTCRGNWIF